MIIYKLKLGFKPRIAILGLNLIVKVLINLTKMTNYYTVKYLSKLGLNSGPFPADTMFLKNREKFDVVIEMYHEQVQVLLNTV